jgi:hypothetical protein
MVRIADYKVPYKTLASGIKSVDAIHEEPEW